MRVNIIITSLLLEGSDLPDELAGASVVSMVAMSADVWAAL